MDRMRVCAFTRFFIPALIALAASSAAAQDKPTEPSAPGIAIGSRVRFTESERRGLFRQRRQIVGTVTAADQTSLTLLTNKGAAVTIPRTSKGLLEVSLGKRRPKGAILGALGLGVSLAGLTMLAETYGGGYDLSMTAERPRSGRLAAGAGLAGLGVGGLLASVRKEDRWAKTTMAASTGTETQIRVDPTLDLKGRGVGLRIGFSW